MSISSAGLNTPAEPACASPLGSYSIFFLAFSAFCAIFFKKKIPNKDIFGKKMFFFKKMMTVYFKKKYQKNDDHVSQKQIPKKIMTVCMWTQKIRGFHVFGLFVLQKLV
jgi:type I restriction-modification system DNA methylase subunit